MVNIPLQIASNFPPDKDRIAILVQVLRKVPHPYQFKDAQFYPRKNRNANQFQQPTIETAQLKDHLSVKVASFPLFPFSPKNARFNRQNEKMQLVEECEPRKEANKFVEQQKKN